MPCSLVDKQVGKESLVSIDKARRILALLHDPKRRAKVMDDFNDANPPSGPSTSQQGMSILKDINEFEDDHERYMDLLRGVEN
jgi:hypothetical protein